MMQPALNGRLGKDPQAIQAKTGTAMAAASVAVDVSTRNAEATVWIRVTAFGLRALVGRNWRRESTDWLSRITGSHANAEMMSRQLQPRQPSNRGATP